MPVATRPLASRTSTHPAAANHHRDKLAIGMPNNLSAQADATCVPPQPSRASPAAVQASGSFTPKGLAAPRDAPQTARRAAGRGGRIRHARVLDRQHTADASAAVGSLTLRPRLTVSRLGVLTSPLRDAAERLRSRVILVVRLRN